MGLIAEAILNGATIGLTSQRDPRQRVGRQPPGDGIPAARRDARLCRRRRIGRVVEQEPQQQLRQLPPDDAHLRRADSDTAAARSRAQQDARTALLFHFDARQPRHGQRRRQRRHQRRQGESQGTAYRTVSTTDHLIGDKDP